jgi:hypothetical protein
VATTSHQFARTLGGAVGIGLCGGLVTARMAAVGDLVAEYSVLNGGPSPALDDLQFHVEDLLKPEFQARLPADLQQALQGAVVDGVSLVFWAVFFAALVCLLLCAFLPDRYRYRDRPLKP